ncbi:hypothetical protein FEP92_04419 [Burkholderia multivorans]|nr:hypothetical protein [Burkholderia multivorans]
MRLHSVAAENFELVGDHLAHRHRRRRMLAEHQPDLHVPAAATQVRNRVEAGARVTQRVERHVRAAAGDVLHRIDDIGDLRCIDGRRGAYRARERKRGRRNVDRDDIRTDRVRDHDRRQPDAAAAVHRDPFACRRAPLIGDCAKRRDEPAAEARRGRKIERVGQPHEVQVRMMDADEFGERTPVREARLKLPLAHLLVAGVALRAAAAASDERHGHAVAGLPARDVRTGRDDHACQFVSRHVRQHDVRIVPHPAVPVAAADAGRLHLDHDAVRRGRRVRDLHHARRGAECFVNDCFHDFLQLRMSLSI